MIGLAAGRCSNMPADVRNRKDLRHTVHGHVPEFASEKPTVDIDYAYKWPAGASVWYVANQSHTRAELTLVRFATIRRRFMPGGCVPDRRASPAKQAC